MALDVTNQNLVLISKLFATLGTRVLHWGSALRDDPKRLLVRCNVFLSIFAGL